MMTPEDSHARQVDACLAQVSQRDVKAVEEPNMQHKSDRARLFLVGSNADAIHSDHREHPYAILKLMTDCIFCEILLPVQQPDGADETTRQALKVGTDEAISRAFSGGEGNDRRRQSVNGHRRGLWKACGVGQ
jgi:hypothetical protein